MLDLPIPIPGSRSSASGLHGSSDALAIAELAKRRRPVAVLTSQALDGQRLAEEIPFFAPGLRVHYFPDWETLPYDSFSPHQDLISERLATLHQITHGACDVLIVPVATALQRLPPVQFLAAYSFFLKQGDSIEPHALRHQLTLAGYTHVTQVVSPGEYSFRGGVIDLFPMGSALPYRIDLFDNDIESLRTFDVDTQRSIYKVNDVRLLPAREFPTDEDARTRFRQNFREKFEGDPSRSQLYKDVSNGVFPAGIEYYLPLFFDGTALITDYLPAETIVLLHGDLQGQIDAFWRDTRARYELLRGDRDRPLLAPQDLFLLPDQLFAAVKPFARVALAEEPVAQAHRVPVSSLPPLQVDRRADNPLHSLRDFTERFAGRILCIAGTLGRRETMLDYFAEHALPLTQCDGFDAFLAGSEKLMLTVGPVARGFAADDDGFAIVTENELYAAQARARDRREPANRLAAEHMLRDLSEVKVGDPVVHAQHGIGRYLGLVTLDLGEGATEFLALEYEGGDKLYVPVSHLEVIGRYSGAAPEAAPLHKLGSGQWEKAKRKAAEQVRDTAAELLNLYAQRAARKGHAFTLKPHDYEAFADGFPFEETRDQAAAIDAVVGDLTIGKPMDRLVCGDVGFGKTEVALRAAFIAVLDGKQVAVLVPTTLLAEQHFQTFSDRFADWPVKIAELSRFRSSKEQETTLSSLAQGRIDIVIGTHKLIQDKVRFKNLGLVIIDEEHRFGVRHKERLKALRAEVDVLTLTATPIPRTLAMSLEGLRDFSVIATAPQKRLAIKTFVSRFSEGLVREAVLRELKRGGQVYYVHNQVETIENTEARLTNLLPEARIRIAHGQMPERELELVMRDFYQQRFSVLLCSTIIETGIDVPTANTIIIDRADKLGLAQLHQLRGRVGRSHHQAYAYLLVHDPEGLTRQAQRRLEAIQQMEELGSGFYLAMHDLEIRGAGEVLGDKQSGEIHEIGFQLYTDMLNAAVKALKAGKEPDLMAPLAATTEINLGTPALLPNDYCADVHERLSLYKRLANCEGADGVDDIQEELIDRFGRLPAQAQALIETHRLRIAAAPLGVRKIDAGEASVSMQFVPNPPIDAMRIIDLVQKNRHIKLAGQDKLRIEAKMPDVALRAQTIKHTLRQLAACGC